MSPFHRTIPDPALIEQFIAIVGPKNALIDGRDDLSHYTHENRGLIIGKTPLVLKPATTQEVSAIVSLAASAGVAIVPQGGHTGHAGGAVPSPQGCEIVVTSERLNTIRLIDPAANIMIVEAGTILEHAQTAATNVNRLFPLSLAAQGSCHIGGNIATNAGGINVLAYGSMRDLVLGLEVVLADGSIWNGLRALKKDNTGYDLKHLFIGAEGTLGFITAATLRLFPQPRSRETAFVGLANVDDALALLNLTRDYCGRDSLVAFELISDIGLEFVLRHGSNQRHPLADRYHFYVLMEIVSYHHRNAAREQVEAILGEALDRQIIADAVLAESSEQRQRLWSLRETLPGAQKFEGGSIKHDISVPIDAIADFLRRAEKRVHTILPTARICAFGHLGDGNIHYNITQPTQFDLTQFMAYKDEIEDAVYDLVTTMNGSISAEHGIGIFKRDRLSIVKSREEYALMKTIKAALDPNGLFNPGKLLPERPER